MSISSETNRVLFAGNDVTTVFSYPHRFLDEGDLVVILRVDSTGVETTKTLTTHYTVAGEDDDAGGSVTMLTAPATGETLIIYNDPATTQGVDLVQNQSFPADTADRAWDRLTLLVQRLREIMTQSVRQTPGAPTAFDPTLPAVVTPYQMLAVNGDGTGWDPDAPTTDDLVDLADSVAAAAASEAAAAASASAASDSADAAAASEAAAAASASAASDSADAAAASAAEAAATVAQMGSRAGQAALSDQDTSKTVTFSSALNDTNYQVVAVMVNVTDSSPQFQPITITAKTTDDFTAKWNSPVDGNNYILSYIVIGNI